MSEIISSHLVMDRDGCHFTELYMVETMTLDEFRKRYPDLIGPALQVEPEIEITRIP